MARFSYIGAWLAVAAAAGPGTAWAEPAAGVDSAAAVTPSALPQDISPSFETPPPAAAEPPVARVERPRMVVEERVEPETPGWHHAFDLTARLLADGVSAIETLGPLATDLRRTSGPAQMDYRSRAGGKVLWLSDGFVRRAEGRVEVEFRRSDLNTPETDLNGTQLRRGGVEVTTGVGRFTVGRTVSQWGLGLVANDGGDDPLQFGGKRGGHTVTRLGWAILPAAIFQGGDPAEAFPLALAVAYDWVGRDDLANRSGDSAHNAVAALLYQGSILHAGVYGVHRDQRDALGLTTDAKIVDGFVRWRVNAQQGRYALLAGEGALIQGHTGWMKTVGNRDGLDIKQFGGVARVELGSPFWSTRIEAGIASADARPLDGTLRNFRFASDYHVGLVLFPQVQRAMADNAAANLGDPKYSAYPPAGVERLGTGGAVTQASYIHPVVRWQVSPMAAVLLGGLWAESPSAVADPYRTWLAGGRPTGPRGGVGSRDLGMEFDAGLETVHGTASWLQLVARLDAGVWFPGAAFNDADGRPMAAVGAWQGTLLLRSQL